VKGEAWRSPGPNVAPPGSKANSSFDFLICSRFSQKKISRKERHKDTMGASCPPKNSEKQMVQDPVIGEDSHTYQQNEQREHSHFSCHTRQFSEIYCF
jgi:hypothetical protein